MLCISYINSTPPPNLPVFTMQQKKCNICTDSVLFHSFHQQVFGHFLFLLLEVVDLVREYNSQKWVRFLSFRFIFYDVFPMLKNPILLLL